MGKAVVSLCSLYFFISCTIFLSQVSKGQAAEASEPKDSLVGPEEDVEDTGHLQVHAKNGVVIPEDTAEEVPTGDGKAEKEAQEKELEELEEGSSDEGDEEITLSGIKKRSTGSGGTNPREDKSRPRGHRRKRYILKAEEKRWTKGILPYVYDSILDAEAKAEIEATMKIYERHTCFRFVPYNSTTRDLYGLDHDGHLFFTKSSGCMSILGNVRNSKGQPISCCTRGACVHEVGHALGLFHEHTSPYRAAFLQINWQNIQRDYYAQYKVLDDTVAKESQYDISSPMHYFAKAFSKNGRRTITQLMDAPGYHIGGNNFYMFREVAEAHKCAELVCPDAIPACSNDGYPAVQDGKCQCACPDGLDPRTGCKKVIRTKEKRTTWPGGSYSLLQPVDGCPDGFTEGERTQATETGNQRSADFHLAGQITRNTVQLKFCSQTSGKQTDVEWGAGRYCILRKGGKCPKGFADGNIQFDDVGSSAPEDTSSLPDGTFGEDTMYSYCCRNDGFTRDPMRLPNDKPFVLFRHKVSRCQSVAGMLATPEYYTVDNEAGRTVKAGPSGQSPHVQVWSRRLALQVFYCYYVPLQQDCGRVIILSKARPVQKFMSVNHPRKYPNNKECTYLIKGPKGSTIILDFMDFDVEETSTGCADHVEVRDNLIGQPGAFYCGQRIAPSIRSQRNQMLVKFLSGGEGQFRGFNATVRLVLPEAMCYSANDSGVSYRGKVNYTIHYEPCVRWEEATHCLHNQYSPSGKEADLSENYCRNIGGGAAPWCYVDRDTCTRQYCEPCGLTRTYDTLDNCADLISGNTDFCKTDPRAVPGCFRSCQKLFDWLPSASQPASKISCSPPTVPDDATLMTSQAQYAVGEVAVLQCKTGKERLEPRCLSDGTWSSGGYVCGACSSGWTPFSGACYQYHHEPKTHKEARLVCQTDGGVLAPARTSAENDFLVNLRHHMRKLWLGMEYKDGALMWTEGTPVGWTNWDKEIAVDRWTAKTAAVLLGEDKDNKWEAKRFWDTIPRFSFVCRTQPSDRVLCEDRRSTCQQLLTEDGSMCEKHPNFAWQECPKTCGVCGKPARCTAPAQGKGVNVVMRPKSLPLRKGQHVHLACKPGFVRSAGNFKRACIGPGRLSGRALVCTEMNGIITRTSEVVLRPRPREAPRRKTYTAVSAQLKVEREGEVLRWELFTGPNTGQLALQVWRPGNGGAQLTFVGQNVITTPVGNQLILEDIPDGERIAIQAGDVLGVWWDTAGSGVPYDVCSQQSQGLVLRDSVSDPALFAVGGMYNFDVDNECKLFSLRAVIGPKK